MVAPSHLVAGLQLADLVVCAAQRLIKRRGDFDDEGNAGAFENIARDVLAALPSPIEDLRGDQSLAGWAL